MTKEAARQSDAAVLAIVHRAGDSWHVLIASTRTSPPTVVETRSFPADDHAAIGPWIEGHKPAEVIRVLPAGSVICRTFPLPAADAGQLDEALRLQAEAHLAGTAPDYRIGMTVLDEAAGESSRTGIVVAWPERAPLEPFDTPAPVRYAPDIAALAGLLDGERPAAPIVWADRHDGALAMALTHSGGAKFRATRENGDDETPWHETVGRILGETALGAGHTPGFIESIVSSTREQLSGLGPGMARLVLPPDIASTLGQRIKGAGGERSWWDRYGIAVGIVLARTSQLATLTELERDAPIERPSIVRSTIERLSSPSTAVKAAIACLLVLALGPLAFNAARLQVLKLKHGGIDEQMRTVEEARRVRSMFEELETERWTMTKLLADLSNCTPLGIEFNQVRITYGDSVSVTGTAIAYDELSPPEVVAKLQRQLYDSGIFSNVTLRRQEVNNLGGYEFDLSAKVDYPHRRARFDETSDFAVMSYRELLYGPPPEGLDEGALASTATTTEAMSAVDEMLSSVDAADDFADDERRAALDDQVASTDTEDTRSSRRPMRTAPEAGPGGRSLTGGDSFSEAGRARADAVPPPMTPEQVDAMTRQEALQALAQVSGARRYAKSAGETELEERLRKDFDLLMERVKRK